MRFRLLEVNGKLVLTKSKDDMIRLLSISPSPAQLVVMRIRSSNELVSSVAPTNLQNPQSALAQVGRNWIEKIFFLVWI